MKVLTRGDVKIIFCDNFHEYGCALYKENSRYKIINFIGRVKCYFENNNLHRENGPAIISFVGCNLFYKNGIHIIHNIKIKKSSCFQLRDENES